MRELLIATANKKKIPGLTADLAGVPFDLKTLNDISLPQGYTVEEPGTTYEAHAAIKAFTYGRRANMLALADDSGLEIDALGGEPGVHAATWLSGTDEDRMNGILERMRGVPDEKRTARFHCTIAIYDPRDDKVRFAYGSCGGRITDTAEGSEGMGYDPIFYSEELKARFGTSPLSERAKVSHRARALAQAREILLREFV